LRMNDAAIRRPRYFLPVTQRSQTAWCGEAARFAEAAGCICLD